MEILFPVHLILKDESMPLKRSFRTRKQPFVDTSALADISLLLLLFFAVTLAGFRDHEEKPIELPSAQSSWISCGDPNPVLFTLDRDGNLDLDMFIFPIEKAELYAKVWEKTYPHVPEFQDFIQIIRIVYPRSRFWIRADGNASYAAFLALNSMLQEQGIHQYTLLTQDEPIDPDMLRYAHKRRVVSI